MTEDTVLDVQDSPSSITLSDVLALPELSSVDILVGADRLDTPIRWVHVAESPRASALIDGGELVLTIGMGFGTNPDDIRAHIFEFYENGAAAILVELGTYWDEVPDILITEARRLNIPLICCRQEIKFVVITEKIHSAILSGRYHQIAAFHEVSESFWSLMHNGAPAEQLVAHVGRLLDCPVVLEDLTHRVLCYAAGHELPSLILNRWGKRSRAWAPLMQKMGLTAEPVELLDPFDTHMTWTYIDIHTQGKHWGRLYTRGTSKSLAGIGFVLRHAAMALAVDRLSTADRHSWADLGDRTALSYLMGNRFTTVEGERVVLEAEGLPTIGRSLFAAEVRAPVPAHILREGITVRIPGASCLASSSNGHVLLAISLAERTQKEELFSVLESLTDGALTIVSDLLAGPVDLASSLHELKDAYFPADSTGLRELSHSRLEGLLHGLRNDVRVQSFADELLGPLLRHDDRSGGDLVPVLRALMAHPDSRSAAAADLHLSRTALYQRIATIERLLGASLNDADTQFALGLALRAYRVEPTTH